MKVAEMNIGDVVNIDTYESGTVTGEIVKITDKFIVLKTCNGSGYLNVLY